jgi:hypothetical protein
MSAHFFLQYRLLTSFQQQSIAHAAWKHGYRVQFTQSFCSGGGGGGGSRAAASIFLPPIIFCKIPLAQS